uniref:Uncharacterized protein n=1 Tax=Thermocrinis ruber TaxID=75906 RepID=A0A7C5WZB1_9AQUI
MHMLLLIGVSVGFALSVLTANNFYSERTFTSSANQWMCNEAKAVSGEKGKGCESLIARSFDQGPGFSVGQFLSWKWKLF